MLDRPSTSLALAATLLALCAGTAAAPLQVNVSVTNLAAANGISFAPLRLGFNNGSFDAFNLGQVAGAAIISVAEGGSGAAWLPAFAAAEAAATIGSVGGVLLPGVSASASFTVDPAVNAFFTFGAMVVPSNDFFVGNDSPTAHRLFNASGQLQTTSITVRASEIWDAGSEVFDPAAAAFVGDNGLRTPQGSVVALNFAELAGFNGLTTAAGYVFTSGLRANSDVYRISFTVSAVPEPGAAVLLASGLVVLPWLARRRRRDFA